MLNYIKESFYELKNNVTWPTTKELTNAAAIVIVASILLGLMIWVMDLAWAGIFSYIYGS